jgi:hypothetical protein
VGELLWPASIRPTERRTLLFGSQHITIEAPPLSNIDRGVGLEAPDGINETSLRNRVSKKQQLLKGTSQMRERSSFGVPVPRGLPSK